MSGQGCYQGARCVGVTPLIRMVDSTAHDSVQECQWTNGFRGGGRAPAALEAVPGQCGSAGALQSLQGVGYGPQRKRHSRRCHWRALVLRCQAKAVQRLLDPARMTRILDVGAGSGYFSHFLLHHTEAAEAWCVDTSYAAESDELRAGKPVHYRRAVASVDADRCC